MNRWGTALSMLLVSCYTYVQLKDIECKTFCKSAQGYDSGVYTNESCWCANKISDDRIQEKKLLLPKKKGKSKYSTIIPYNIPDEEITKLPWE